MRLPRWTRLDLSLFSQKINISGIKILFVSASGRRRLPARAMPAFGVAGRAVLPLLKSEVSILTF